MKTIKSAVFGLILSLVMVLSAGSALANNAPGLISGYIAGYEGPVSECQNGYQSVMIPEKHYVVGENKFTNWGGNQVKYKSTEFNRVYNVCTQGVTLYLFNCDIAGQCSESNFNFYGCNEVGRFTETSVYYYHYSYHDTETYTPAVNNYAICAKGTTGVLKSAEAEFDPYNSNSDEDDVSNGALNIDTNTDLRCSDSQVSIGSFIDIYDYSPRSYRGITAKKYHICLDQIQAPLEDVEAVEALSVGQITSTSAVLSWINPSQSHFDGVRIEVHCDSSGTQAPQDLRGLNPGDSGTYTITNLAPSEECDVEITSIDEDDNFGEEDDIDFTTLASGTTGAADFTISAITLGGSSQARDADISGQFTITNSGQSGITVEVTSSAAAKYNVVLSNVPTGQITSSATVDISARVPKDFSAVDSSCKPAALEIGTISVKAGTVTKTAKILMQAENKLVFDDVKLYVDGDKESVSDGDSVDVIPKSEIEVKAVVENIYSNSEDIKIEDVELTVEADDNELEVEEEFDLDDIDADDDATASVLFDMPYDVEEETYEMEIRVCGEDENGAMHGDYMKVSLDVKKEKHQLLVETVSMEPSSVTCNRDTFVNVKLINIGKNDEQDITVRVSNSALGIIEQASIDEIEEGDSRTVSIPIEVSDSARASTYTFNVDIAYEEETFREQVTLLVNECQSAKATIVDSGSDSEEIEVLFRPGTGSGTTEATVVEDSEDQVQEKSSHVAFLELAVLSLLVILLVLGLFVYFRLRSQESPKAGEQPQQQFTQDYYQATEGNGYYKEN